MVESSLTEVTAPLAAASTGVFSGTMKSIAFQRFPARAGEDVLSTLSNNFFATLIAVNSTFFQTS